MKVNFSSDVKNNNIVVFVFEGEKSVRSNSLNFDLSPLYTAKATEVDYTFINGKNVVVVGLGKEEDFKLMTLKKSLKKALDFFSSKKISQVDIYLKSVDGFENSLIAEHIVHTAVVGTYKFDKYISKKEYSLIEEITLVSDDFEDYRDSVLEKLTVFENSNFSRELIVENSWTINPETFAKKVEAWAKEHKDKGVKVHILDKKDLEKENMNLHLAVGNGGRTEPYLVVLEYIKDENKPSTGFVGKGLCFDAGGYNLKPTNYIEDMKMDMAGAATVFGAFKSIVENELDKNVVCVLGLAENLIGKDAFRPGDVFVARNGMSVEIGNTDAEGRLVLADALDFIQDKYNVENVIDLATLTGAITVGLGLHYTGLFGNDDELKSKLMIASENIDEQLWEMPLDSEHEEMMKGKIADLSNISGHRYGGSSTAAAFLKYFIKDETKWCHLDIAGTAWIEKYDWGIYDKSLPTGLGVNLLYNFVKES